MTMDPRVQQALRDVEENTYLRANGIMALQALQALTTVADRALTQQAMRDLLDSAPDS